VTIDQPATGVPDEATEPSGRRALSLLLDPNVGSYFVGKLFAATAMWIHNVVAVLVVYDMTRSVFLVGMVSVCQFLPQLVLAPWAGVQADRGNRRRQAVAGRLISGLAPAGVAVWFAVVGQDGTHPAVLMVGALLLGAGTAIGQPATHALLPSLVARNELAAVVTLDTVPMTVARAAGPAVGALLLTAAGPAVAFATVAAGQTLHGLVLWAIRLRPEVREKQQDSSFRGGLRHLKTDPAVALLLLGVIGIGLGVDPVITLTPALADDLGGGAELVALMTSAFGFGAVTAPLVLGVLRIWLRESVIATLGLSLLATCMAALTVSGTPVVAVAFLYVGGVGMMLGVTSFTTELQGRLPGHLRGRIMALWAVAFIGTRPLAAAVNGGIADLVSVEAALGVLVLVLVVIVIWTRPAKLARAGRPPSPSATTPGPQAPLLPE
jgi:MFS family permease